MSTVLSRKQKATQIHHTELGQNVNNVILTGMGVLLCLQVFSLSLSHKHTHARTHARTHTHTLLHGETFFTRLSRGKRHHEITRYKAETASLEHAMVRTILYRTRKRERVRKKR